MIQPLTVGHLVAMALDRGEECPPDTAAVIRHALTGVCDGCGCTERLERRVHSVFPRVGVERRRARVGA